MIEFGQPPKIAKPAIIRPRPARIIRPGEPDYRVPGLGATGFALTPMSGFGANASGGGVPATVNYVTKALNTSGLSEYTFSTQSIGTAATGRRVIVSFHTLGGSSQTITAFTVGGNAASLVGTAEGTGGGAYARCALYIIQIDSGTTATIVVTLSGGVSRAGIGIIAAYDLLSSTPTDSGTSTSNPPTTALDISAGGIAVGAATPFQAAANPTTTWTGLANEHYDEFLVSTGGMKVLASEAFASEQSARTVTATPTGFTATAFVAASFR